jgi:tRNA G10  N-methylase Trm11
MSAPAPHSKYWFILGRETQISAAEIAAILSTKNYEIVNSILKVESVISNPKELIKKLGGTIKIAKEMASQVREQDIEQLIIEELKTVSGKINFGISLYTNERNDFADLKLAEEFGKKIKKSLKAEGLSVRYVENREPVLSSVTVEKNNLTGRGREFILQKQLGGYSLAKTEAVQPFEEFSARDFGRPGRDDLSGMLPPKLAMMMINLAQAPTTATLLDPFCGSGTILSEALLLGYTNLIGTDISEKATSDSRENMAWIADQFGISDNNLSVKIQTESIENLNSIVASNSIDTIVTEPYMGRPLKGNEKKEDLVKQGGELKNLYLQAFSKFAKILKSKGRVVFLIPRFKYQNDWIQIDCQNEIQQLGFKLINFFEDKPSLLYARPNQRVAREIWGFEKK